MDKKQHQIAPHQYHFRPQVPERIPVNPFRHTYVKSAMRASVLMRKIGCLLYNDNLTVGIRRYRKLIIFYTGHRCLPAVPGHPGFKKQLPVHVHSAGKVHTITTDEIASGKYPDPHTAGSILDFISRLSYADIRPPFKFLRGQQRVRHIFHIPGKPHRRLHKLRIIQNPYAVCGNSRPDIIRTGLDSPYQKHH